MGGGGGGGCPLKQFFPKTSAMEIKTFGGFLISYVVPTMVGEWVYQIVFQYHVDCLFMTFGVANYTRGPSYTLVGGSAYIPSLRGGTLQVPIIMASIELKLI